jgi:hypothetical protein
MRKLNHRLADIHREQQSQALAESDR